MRRLLLVLVLIAGCVGCVPESKITSLAGPKAGSQVIGYCDGSVIFWRGGLLVKPIYRHTDSTITHAAVILYQNGKPWVYEAVPPRIHKVPLGAYLEEMKQKMQKERLQRRGFTYFMMQPRTPYSHGELAAMKWYAESQLGRPYMLRGWWKEREVRGLFCSQYIGNIIEQSGLIESSNWRESPGGLHAKLSPYYY